MSQTLKVVAFLSVALLLTSCFSYPLWTQSYEGDGMFKDNGPKSSPDRYVLDLGEVDFSKTKSESYELGYLPNERFWIGFEGLISQFQGEHPVVRLRLEDATDRQTIFDFEEEVYDGEGRGKGGWNYSGPSGGPYFASITEPFDSISSEARDRGHMGGTEFIPKRRHKYHLEFSIVKPITYPESCRLVIKGGGWK